MYVIKLLFWHVNVSCSKVHKLVKFYIQPISAMDRFGVEVGLDKITDLCFCHTFAIDLLLSSTSVLLKNVCVNTWCIQICHIIQIVWCILMLYKWQ